VRLCLVHLEVGQKHFTVTSPMFIDSSSSS
jgi:hypothetical protein